jgi:PAS domain S-box-containing protein
MNAQLVLDRFNREELFQTLFEENGDALFLFDPDTEELVDVNPTVQRFTGFSRKELMQSPVSYYFRAEAQGRLSQLRHAFRKTGAYHSMDGFLLRTSQSGVWIAVNITITRLHVRPRVLGLITARDMRESRRVRAELVASEARYRSLSENLEQCIFVKDKNLRLQAVNRGFCAAVGLPEAELLGKTDSDLYPPELAAQYRADDLRVLREGTRLEVEEQNPAGGKMRTVRVIKTPVRDASGEIVGVQGIFWDVSEQRGLEAQLRQAQKMEAVGQLAGGVAHDFNNLLTIILGNIGLIQASLSQEDRRHELLAASEKAARRGAELTAKMLGFSRQTTLRLQPVNLNAAIEEAVALLRRSIDPRIELLTRPANDLWAIEADAGQINQVLMNLCLNARDAMAEGGRLLLDAENVVVGDDTARRQIDARTGEYVRLRVRDTGAGIPAEILPRIFDPFFTTKEPGKGTGLGLAMVFGIVKQHQGWIDCNSKVGAGTCFELYFPRLHTARTAPAASNGTRQGTPPGRGNETILLADDEPMVRNLGSMILQRFGYAVRVAADGQQAVDLYLRERHHIDLVILDLTMPGLSGRDAFRKLVQIDPAVRVLFASGFSAEHIDGPELDRVLGFVAKPYTCDELVRAVRTALDHASPPATPPLAAIAAAAAS